MGGRARYITTAVIISIIVVASLGLSCMLQRNTLIEWWKPVVICFLPSCAVGLALSRVIRVAGGVNKPWLTYVAGIVLSFSVIMAGFYSLNFYKSKPGTASVCQAVVARKYTKERFRTKRLSRHRSVRGEKYTVYCVDIELQGGWTKHFEVEAGEYARIRKGRKFDLDIEEGLFGVPVIKNMSLPVGKLRKIRKQHY